MQQFVNGGKKSFSLFNSFRAHMSEINAMRYQIDAKAEENCTKKENFPVDIT